MGKKEITVEVQWDYGVSVEKMKVLVPRWKDLTVEVLRELHAAREALRSQGARTDLGSSEPKLTWSGYCGEIGIAKSSANRWLSRFDPETGEVKELPAPESKAEIKEITEGLDTVQEKLEALREYEDAALHRAQEAVRDRIGSMAEVGRFLNMIKKDEELQERNQRYLAEAEALIAESALLDIEQPDATDQLLAFLEKGQDLGKRWDQLFVEMYELREINPKYEAFESLTWPKEKQAKHAVESMASKGNRAAQAAAEKMKATDGRLDGADAMAIMKEWMKGGAR